MTLTQWLVCLIGALAGGLLALDEVGTDAFLFDPALALFATFSGSLVGATAAFFIVSV